MNKKINEKLNKEIQEKIIKIDKLTLGNDIELKYHYSFFGYLKLLAGGTSIPHSVDVFKKDDHSFIKTINKDEILNDLADY